MGVLKMRIYGAGLVLALASAACEPETVPPPQPPPVAWSTLEPRAAVLDAGSPSATSKERAVTDAYLRALSSPGVGTLANLLDDDAHFSLAGYKDVHGRDNIVRLHDTLFTPLDDRQFSAQRVFSTENTQIVEWLGKGTRKKTKEAVTFKGLVVLATKDDGTISNVELYCDERFPPATDAPQPRVDIEQTRDPQEVANIAIVREALPATAKQYVKDSKKSVTDLDASPDNAWGVGPFVIVEYHVTGEQKAGLFKLFIVDVDEVRDGKIINTHRYDNPAQIITTPR